MKHILIILALAGLIGCGEETEPRGIRHIKESEFIPAKQTNYFTDKVDLGLKGKTGYWQSEKLAKHNYVILNTCYGMTKTQCHESTLKIKASRTCKTDFRKNGGWTTTCYTQPIECENMTPNHCKQAAEYHQSSAK